ncbi:hypothetical protein HZS_6155 [Henneguya salminicola]|nr:hypothetical protein HZS_6155 [Henneguya salminicola]
MKLKKLHAVKNLTAVNKWCWKFNHIQNDSKRNVCSFCKNFKKEIKGQCFPRLLSPNTNLDMHMTPKEHIEYLCNLCGYCNIATKYVFITYIIFEDNIKSFISFWIDAI